jgi:hypothetical protein
LALALKEMKYGEAWRSWPDPEWYDGENDIAPYWSAGLKFIHEILPAEAAAAPQFASPVHLETYLYSWLKTQAEELFVDRLHTYHDPPFWTPGTTVVRKKNNPPLSGLLHQAIFRCNPPSTDVFAIR